MVPITKRIRTKLALETIKKFEIIGPILDIGSGDGYFVKKAKEKGINIQGIDLENGKDFFNIESTQSKVVTGLALLWHIDINNFFSHCLKLGIEDILLIQSFAKLEPLTKIYTPDHIHFVMNVQDIKKCASNNNYRLFSYETFWCWDILLFKKKKEVDNL